MQSDQPRKTPIRTRHSKSNELLLFLTNTGRLARLLGQVLIRRGVVQTYGRSTGSARRVEAGQRNRLVRRPHRPARPTGPEQQQQWQRTNEDEAAVKVNLRKREHARLNCDLSVKDGKCLLLRNRWIYPARD